MGDGITGATWCRHGAAPPGARKYTYAEIAAIMAAAARAYASDWPHRREREAMLVARAGHMGACGAEDGERDDCGRAA